MNVRASGRSDSPGHPDVRVSEFGRGQREKTVKAQGLAPMAAIAIAETAVELGRDCIFVTVRQEEQLRKARATLTRIGKMSDWREALWETR